MDYKKGLVKLCNFGDGRSFSERRMKTTMSDLPEDLVVEILSRAPLRLVRSTCKKWNGLSQNQIFGKVAEAKNQFVGFIIVDFKICSLRMDLQGISYDGHDIIDVSIKQLSVLNQIKVSKVYHCDGLLLCIPTDNSRLLVWNPYLGQTRSIQHKTHKFHCCYALGYDNDRNHKILEILVSEYNIYEFSSNSWKYLDFSSDCNWVIMTNSHATLKGNAYFYAEEKTTRMEGFLLCFDFTSERFGPRLSLPFHCNLLDAVDTVILSGVRDKQLAVLYYSRDNLKIEIWVTNKIDYNEVEWTKLVEVDMNLVTDSPFDYIVGSFFIDEENKVAVVFSLSWRDEENRYYKTAHIFGQNRYFKSIYVPGASYKWNQVTGLLSELAPLCCSYVPSLVHIE